MKLKYNQPFIFICLLIVSCFGCGKSDQSPEAIAEQKAIERHKMDLLHPENAPGLKITPWQKLDTAASTSEAMRYLANLLKSGTLPDTSDIERRLTFRPYSFSTNFPLTRTFSVKMKSSPFRNYYEVVKVAPGASWELRRAWRTDAQNKLIKEYAPAQWMTNETTTAVSPSASPQPSALTTNVP